MEPESSVSAGPPLDLSPAAEVVGPRRHRNGEKMIEHAERVWQVAAASGLIGIKVDHKSNNELVVREGEHAFMMLSSCSYLGLNRHPKVVEGSVRALNEVKTTCLSLAEVRVRLNLLARLEAELGELFGAPVIPGVSCSALTAGILPLLASGHVADGKPRVMVFDRFCHFSMAYIKLICAEEALVLTAPHNDLNYLEDVCRKYPRVAYVADGAYSMGGLTALDGLVELQQRYGLFLYFDDSHSLSIHGARGEGYVRSHLELNPLTLIVASLAKAFGTSGGVAMLGSAKLRDFLYRNAGPVAWSQNVDVAAIGASLASLEIHRSPELSELQEKLQVNIRSFDREFPTQLAGNGLSIRKIDVGDETHAVRLSRELYERGYYCSAVFFPIVPKGEAGVRIMLRADIEPHQLERFARTAHEIVATF
jgi:7-keto-8-aminopelargonate synthetase-like enzyme